MRIAGLVGLVIVGIMLTLLWSKRSGGRSILGGALSTLMVVNASVAVIGAEHARRTVEIAAYGASFAALTWTIANQRTSTARSVIFVVALTFLAADAAYNLVRLLG